jgi:putative ABC transport system ATP-binding protein
MTTTPQRAPVPDLAALQQRAAQRAAARAGGNDRLRGHLVCDGLVRIFKADGVEVVALQGLDLVVDRGELLALVGASGSGKSTLLNILSGLDVPTAGTARVGGYDLLTMPAKRRLRYRRHMVGFVWQQTGRNLLPYLTALENVELPMKLAGRRSGRASRARQLLEMVGVGYCADRRPSQLSGGEQQCCAVAVAAANDPEVLFADEPTGELDEATAAKVFGALQTINAELGVTIVVVTHDPAVATQVHRTVAIRDGRTASEVRRTARLTDDGETEMVTEEYAVLDRTGRMQLPATFVEALSLKDRVKLNLEPDHVEVRSGEEAGQGEERAEQGLRSRAKEGPMSAIGAGRPEVGGVLLDREPMVSVEHVSRSFGSGSRVVHAVRNVSFTAGRGELVAVRGRSGAGKTTLLNVIGGLDRPTSGRVTVAGHDVTGAGERELLHLRREGVGFVFQSFGLIPILSAAENVGVPLRLAKVAAAEREERVAVLLELVGLGGHAAQRPYELSGGQQQRVAVARALANDPQLLIADEPTGQLDSETGRSIMDLLRAVVHARGMTALVATHDPGLIDLADRILVLRDGHLVDE